MGMRLGKARKTCGFMMEPLERRELLDGTAPVQDPQTAPEIVLAADAVTDPLAAPIGVNVSKVFSTALIVGWSDQSEIEAGFRIERTTDSINWTTAGTVGPNVTSFEDTGLVPDTAYNYRVVAFSDIGTESVSDATASATSSQKLQVTFDANGLHNITYDGTTLTDLDAFPPDGFRINDYKIRKADGTIVSRGIDKPIPQTFDTETQTLSYRLGWGTISVHYVQEYDRLNLFFTVTNTTDTWTIMGVNLFPLTLRFPVFPEGYTGTAPKMGYNGDGPTAIPADWGTGTMVLTNNDTAKPLYVGLFTDPMTATDMNYDLWVGSTPLQYQPGSWTKFDRPIAPGQSDQYSVSLRFGPTGATATELAPDIYASAAENFPYALHWDDRRPIGQIQLALYTSRSKTNPRGFFDKSVNVLTTAGLRDFRRRLLASADRSVTVLKNMNAQGMIVWNLEGEQYRAVTYVGDPTKLKVLAPEMEYNSAVDSYFARFRNAGLRVGVAIRAQKLVKDATGAWKQVESSDPYKNIKAKIAYAHNRWGATLFYIDSNVDTGGNGEIDDPMIFKKLAAAFPDCLIIPEHENTRYYAFTSPYHELRYGETSTPDVAREAYPEAFSTIYVPGGDIDGHHDELVTAVRNGDILMFPGWFDSPENAKVKAIYDEASAPPA